MERLRSLVELGFWLKFRLEVGVGRVRSLVELAVWLEFNLEVGWRRNEFRLLQNPDHKALEITGVF